MNSTYLKYIGYQTVLIVLYPILLVLFYGWIALSPDWAKFIYYLSLSLSILIALFIKEEEWEHRKLRYAKVLLVWACTLLIIIKYLLPIFSWIF